jgi:hypothetical protein
MKGQSPVAIASTAVGTAAVSVAWFALTSQPQSPPPQRPPDPPAVHALVVCVGQDSILRALPASPGCPPGQGLLPLTRVTGGPEPIDVIEFDDADTKPQPGWKNDALGQLEERVARLQKSPFFTVIDREGNRLFAVAPDIVQVFSSGGAATATINARNNGGFFAATSADRSLSVSVGASASRAGIRFEERGFARLELGRHPTSRWSLKVSAPAAPDGTIAGIGESAAGTAAVVAGDQAGRIRASMTFQEGRGNINIFSADGTSIASLREAQNGGGLLSLGDASGREAVKMDVITGYGAVLAGPSLGLPLVTGSGLPGSYFLGCRGGDACRPY